MAAYSTATLIAEIGTATTKLTLVDLVDGVYRFVAHATTASTIAAPQGDLTVALVELARTIEEITGRTLVREGRLLVPADEQGNGAQRLAVTTSAAGVVRIVVTALAAHQSAQEAINAARGTYAGLEHVFALDAAGAGDEHWLGMQVARLAATRPDAILVAGGLEGGATSALERIGHIVGLLARHVETNPHVVYAGNSAAVENVRAVLGEGVDMEVVDNLRPTAEGNQLEPARAALRRIYREKCLQDLPGYAALHTWQPAYIGMVVEDQAVMVRFLAERFGRNILALDVGGSHTTGLMQADDRFSQVVLAHGGPGAFSVPLLDAAQAEEILRWLPFELSAGELRNRLLNRMLHPQPAPIDLDDLLIDLALTREALRATLTAVAQSRPAMRYDLVIGGGALAHAPRPGLAALALLDTLPLTDEDNHFAVELYLDSLHLLAVSGALGHLDPDAAVCVVEQDVLNNGPLATVVVPRGAIDPGSRALEIELRVVGGATQQIEVQGGELVRLPLARGKRATLRIRPAQGIFIGDNPPGAEVLSDEAAISGSALGVLVDARPRPLALPDDQRERQQMLLRWLRTLNAIPQIESAERALVSVPSEPAPDAPPTREPVMHDPAPAEQASAAGATSEQAVFAGEVEAMSTHDQELDLQAMRASLVEPPKPKRGLFGRRS